MLLSLVTGAIGILNASAFLLMTSGLKLLEYIVISSIFSLASSLYSWVLPAAVGYRVDMLPQLRLLQLITVGVAAAIILASHSGVIGITFVLMMIVDVAIFPAAILLFRSQTGLFLRIELVRGIANSVALLIVLLGLQSDPQAYAIMLLLNVVGAGLAMAITGVHRPPSLRLASLATLDFLWGREVWSQQLRLLLAARALETSGLMALARFGALSHVLSFKIAMLISSALAVNARAHGLAKLVAAYVGVYAVGISVTIAIRQIDVIPIPPTLKLIDLGDAAVVLPPAILAFVLSVRSLKARASAVPIVASEVGEL